MKSLTLRACAGVLICAPALGSAQDFYAEIGVQGLSVPGGEGVGILTSAALPSALMARGGYDFTPNFGVEADLGIGVSDSRSEVTSTEDNPIGELLATILIGVDVSIKHSAGVFGVGRLPLGATTLYGRVGYVSLGMEVSGPRETTSQTDGGAAVGAGVVFDVGVVDLRIDVTRISAEDDDMSSYSATVGWRF